MGMKPSIDVQIDELVLEGFGSGADDQMHEAIRRELQRRLFASPAGVHADTTAAGIADAVHAAASRRNDG